MPRNLAKDKISNRKEGNSNCGHRIFFFRLLREHYTDILIHLDQEALSMDEFMRGLIEGYLSRDPDFMKYWFRFKDKFAREIEENPRRKNRAALFNLSRETQRFFLKKGQKDLKYLEEELELTEEDKESIFDEFERK